jgi:hypothetical protein
MNLSPNHPQALKDFIKHFEPAPYANLTKEDIKKMNKLIAGYDKKAKEYIDKSRGMKATMKTMCPHADKVLESNYHAGDYYNKAWTDYTVKCADCGDILFSTNEQHSYYG